MDFGFALVRDSERAAFRALFCTIIFPPLCRAHPITILGCYHLQNNHTINAIHYSLLFDAQIAVHLYKQV